MNNSRPLKDRFRTLYESYVSICNGSFQAALILDYFVTVEHMHDEARTQGEHFGEWRNLSVAYMGRIMYTNPSPYMVRTAIKTLTDLGFIEAHKSNSENRGGFSKKSSNKFRLCRHKYLDALDAYHASQISPASESASEISLAEVVNFDQHASADASQNYTQDSLSDSHSDSSSSATRMMDWIEIEKRFIAWAGFTPRPEQQQTLIELANKYGDQELISALVVAKEQKGRSLAYVRRVLANPMARPQQEQRGAARPHIAADSDESGVSVEEFRAMRKEMGLL